MSFERPVRRERFPFPEFDNPMEEEVIETTGKVFSDGECIELIKNKGGSLSLLDSGSKEPTESIERGGQTYVPFSLPPSLLEVLTLPAGRTPYGSTVGLFGRIYNLFVDRGISDECAMLLTYGVFATWFPDLLPIAPYLFISGPRPEAHMAIRLLSCVVRHALPLGDLNSAAFRYLPMHIEPTLLVGNLHSSMYRALSSSSHPHAYLPSKDGFIDLYCAKVVYTGTTLPEVLPGGAVLTINLAPCRRKLPLIDAPTCQAIAADFQPQLLDYRLNNFVKVRDADFDVPAFESDLRVLAHVLGSCIVDAPEVQAGIAPLLQGQQEVLRANRLVDPQCIALEAVLDHCHTTPEPCRVGVAELADTSSRILASRGETPAFEPKHMGRLLRSLGLYPKRDAQGYAFFLTEQFRRQVHRLARDHGITLEETATACAHCSEIMPDGTSGTARDTKQDHDLGDAPSVN